VLGAALGVSLLVAGCSGSSGTTPDANAGESSQASTASPGTTSASPTPTKKKKKNPVAWILSLGPGAPDGPPEFTAYRELQQLHCSKVFDRVSELTQPARTLYTGAANACLAAFDARPDLWSTASTAYDTVAGRRSELSCMDQTAFALLGRLIALHAEFPNRPFTNAPSSAAAAPPCPTIRALTPDHGAAGTVVRVTGQHLRGNVIGVDVVDSTGNAAPAENVTSVGKAIQFTLPAALSADESLACIELRAKPDWSSAGALFRYDSASASGQAPFPCPVPRGS
jgi:hypothetical protein